MNARRKPTDRLTDPIANAAPARPAALVDRDAPRDADDAPASPARLLHEHLAARLADTVASSPPVSSVDSTEPNGRLPVMLRIAIIVTLSIALWGGIYLSIVHVITI